MEEMLKIRGYIIERGYKRDGKMKWTPQSLKMDKSEVIAGLRLRDLIKSDEESLVNKYEHRIVPLYELKKI